MIRASLLEALDAQSSLLGDVEMASDAASVEYRRSQHAFAVASGDSVDLRLGAEIAEAARRTPDAHGSSRGDDWVRFTPHVWDQHASDRLEAWFRVAWRLAGRR